MSGYLQEPINMTDKEYEVWSDKLATTFAYAIRYTIIASFCSALALWLFIPVNYEVTDCILPICYTFAFWFLALGLMAPYIWYKAKQVKS